MPQPSLQQFKRRGFTFKVEVTEGTDAAPLAATDGIMLLNGQSGTEFDKIERAIDRPFFTNNPFGVANKRAFIEGDWELIPPATPGIAGPTAGIPGESLLFTGGMTRVLNAGTKTTRYNPISDAIPSGTGYWWHVDTHKRVLGARTGISALKMAIGERAMARIRVQGSYNNVTEDALPNIILPSTVPVVASNVNSTSYVIIGSAVAPGLLVWAKELSIDFGSAIGTKEYTSHKTTAISDRLATFSYRIAKADLDDFNPWTVRDAGTIIQGNFRTLNTLPTGLYTEIGFRGQIEQINEVDIDGDLGWELTGPCVASNAGGDEVYIEFGDTTP